VGERPLVGKTVVITRPAEQAESLARPLENLGAEVMLAPTIRIVPVPLNDDIRAAIARLSEYQLVVFTSVNGVAEFLGRMRECGRSPEDLAGATIAAIGPRTAAALAAQGVKAGVVPEEFVAEGLLKALGSTGAGRGSRVLIPQASEAREVLPDTLRERGATVDVLPVYDTEPVDKLAVPLAHIAAADYITFTASSTVSRFVELAERAMSAETAGGAADRPATEVAAGGGSAGRPLVERLSGARICAIGPVTAQTLRDLGLPVAIEAAEHTMHGLVRAILADAAAAG
jgi:uroporphyrinogen III methyltransferase/synthase